MNYGEQEGGGLDAGAWRELKAFAWYAERDDSDYANKCARGIVGLLTAAGLGVTIAMDSQGAMVTVWGTSDRAPVRSPIERMVDEAAGNIPRSGRRLVELARAEGEPLPLLIAKCALQPSVLEALKESSRT